MPNVTSDAPTELGAPPLFACAPSNGVPVFGSQLLRVQALATSPLAIRDWLLGARN